MAASRTAKFISDAWFRLMDAPWGEWSPDPAENAKIKAAKAAALAAYEANHKKWLIMQEQKGQA